MRNYLIIIIIISLFGCKPHTPNIKKASLFFDKIIGEWHLDDKTTIEQWEKDNQGNFTSKVLVVKNNDTTIVETIAIVENQKNIYYVATVPNQNGALPIKFKLKTISDDEVSFENPLHDFPQKIQYKLNNSKKLTATISGNVKGMEKIINFTYQKKE